MGGCGGREFTTIQSHKKDSIAPEKKGDERKYRGFDEALKDLFPHAVEYKQFHKLMTALAKNNGFTRDNTIAMFSVCRDEITEHFVDVLEAEWGQSFNISSLAGFVFCGKTGFQACMAHAPKENGLERYLFFCGPHIAISEKGTIGEVMRQGRSAPSHACGALMKFQEELEEGKLSVKDDPQDLEQTNMKQYLVSYLKYGQVPSLVHLTKLARRCIHDMLESTLKVAITDKMSCNYLIVCGILIHGPNDTHYVDIGPLNAMISGKVTNIHHEWDKVAAEHFVNPHHMHDEGKQQE